MRRGSPAHSTRGRSATTSSRLELTRRGFVTASAAALAWTASGCRTTGGPRPRFERDPFTLGVASGSPLADGVVLWTRLAPAPLEPGGGLPPTPIDVHWKVSEDESFRRGVRSGRALALPELAHSVHVELRGLEPARMYWYRFDCDGASSSVGRTRTAATAGTRLERLRLAYASCQHYEQGYYGAYRALLEDDVDLIVHLGDYIYEGASRGVEVRRHEGPEPVDLAGYRARYALYKLDPALQAAHAAHPWVTTWDDHEVDNDYAGDASQDRDDPSAFRARRAAAYQAYYEHMPLWGRARPVGSDARLFQRLAFGDLLELSVLDTRQYRSDQPCGETGGGGGQVVEQCAARLAPSQSFLGEIQRGWLLAGLVRSQVRWNVIAQQTLMAELDQKAGPGEAFWTDAWDGYAAERQRILAALAERSVPNVVVLGGDVHSFFANELRPDFRDPLSPVVASEFVGTSISSDGLPYERFAELLPDNPHVKFFDSRQRGYVRCEITRDRWLTDFRMVESVREPSSPARTLASFAVEAGSPSIQRAS